MISTLHYYGPYNSHTDKASKTPYKKAIVNNKEKSLKLDTAYKEDVISYAKNLSKSVNETKSAVYCLLDDISKLIPEEIDETNYKKSTKMKKQNDLNSDENESDDYDSQVADQFKKSLENFTSVLNKTSLFKKLSSQSEEFDDFSSKVSSIVKGSTSLDKLGLSFEEGNYYIDETIMDSLSVDETKSLLKQSYDDVKSIYDKTSEFLSKPLANHMEFKNFSYYYSYSAGVMQNNAFSLFGSGILLNLEL